MNNRRSFVKYFVGILGGINFNLIHRAVASTKRKPLESKGKSFLTLPDNPLVLFDNFHAGNRRSYSWKAKFAAAQSAGFDGFEFAGVDPRSESWKTALDLVDDYMFSIWGFHMTTRAAIDKYADKINAEIERIQEYIELAQALPSKLYFTLSLSGTDELGGPTVHQRGSAKAQDRHWDRAYKIVNAFDLACKKNNARGSLYPHINWICDTPQSLVKIMDGAKAQHIGPAFCSHHWYGNKASDELDEVLAYPLMKRLNYVVLTNGIFSDAGFQAVRFDEGQIDMAWLLAKLYAFGYKGPISSQGWAIGGDPYVACKRFVETIQSLRKRFQTQPELNPLN